MIGKFVKMFDPFKSGIPETGAMRYAWRGRDICVGEIEFSEKKITGSRVESLKGEEVKSGLDAALEVFERMCSRGVSTAELYSVVGGNHPISDEAKIDGRISGLYRLLSTFPGRYSLVVGGREYDLCSEVLRSVNNIERGVLMYNGGGECSSDVFSRNVEIIELALLKKKYEFRRGGSL